MAGRASAQAALETRQNILEAAADLASIEGLDSVTIGRLAEAVNMSKSGVIGQFRTKESLQLATVRMVFADFRSRVWDTVELIEPGLPRLSAACEAWARYAADPGFTGGCLLTQATYDYDARTGALHDLLASGRDLWRDRLRDDIGVARQAGDLPVGTDTDALIFALESLVAFISPERFLYKDTSAVKHALRGMRQMLGIIEHADSDSSSVKS